MTYLLTQLWLGFLLSGLLGCVIGWILRGGCKRHILMAKRWQTKFHELEKENALNKKKSVHFNRVSHERTRLLSQLNNTKKHKAKLSMKLLKMQEGVKKARVVHQQMNRKQKKTLELLTFAKQANTVKDENIEQLKKESSATEYLLMKCQDDWEAKHRLLRSQRDVSLLNMKNSQEKARNAEHRLKASEDNLTTSQGSMEDIQYELESVKKELVESEGKAVELIETVDMFAAKGNEAESEALDISSQFDEFKQQAKQYIASVTDENNKYKVAVGLLESDIEQEKQQVKDKELELEQVNAELASREQAIVSLRGEYEVLSKRARTAEEAHATQPRQVKEVSGTRLGLHNKKYTVNKSSENSSLLSRWKRIKRSRLLKRPR